MPLLDIETDLDLAGLYCEMFQEAIEKLGGDEALIKLGDSFMMAAIFLKMILDARVRGVADFDVCRDIAIAQLDEGFKEHGMAEGVTE